MTKDEKQKQTPRRPYRKPRVEQVELTAEEQVLGGCKAVELLAGINMDPPYGSCFLWGCSANAS